MRQKPDETPVLNFTVIFYKGELKQSVNMRNFTELLNLKEKKGFTLNVLILLN